TNEVHVDKKKVETNKRTPSSGADEMKVALRKAHQPSQNDEIIVKEKAKFMGGKEHKAKPDKVVTGKYSVQVASNRKKTDSDEMLNKLTEQGFTGYVQEAMVNDKEYYRVRLGPVDSKEEAHELMARVLKVKGISNA